MLPIDFKKEELSEKERRNISILDILRRQGPISRPDISRLMGVNVVTISNYIDDFIRGRLVYERELDVSEGGRRPTLLDLNQQAGYIIGIGLNLMNMVGVLLDLKGNIVTKTQIARPKPSVKEITECVVQLIREILRRSKEYTPNIKGIGIGIAGLVNKKTGLIHWPQKMDHYYTYASVDLPLRDIIEKEFNFPTLIENDATAACFGEQWLDLTRDFKNIIYMFSGVGCGIMINGEIYTGSQGYAGEVSIYNYAKQDQFNCDAGKSCFIKRWEIDMGIIDDIREMLAQDKKKADEFFSLTSSNINNVDLKSVFIANRANHPMAALALEKAAYRLGVKIACMVNFLNPQAVILGGGLEEAGDKFLNQVSSTVREWAFREMTENLEIIYSQLRENAVALGAASLVMHRVFARLL
ncbi:MAG: ROK family protein [Candidatus Omnitrophica bacterium]|jgi:predicted NBD/HSP70 family sugar kinase|nr:ROK family protein [Candidatus Omnitrophota bacterium]